MTGQTGGKTEEEEAPSVLNPGLWDSEDGQEAVLESRVSCNAFTWVLNTRDPVLFLCRDSGISQPQPHWEKGEKMSVYIFFVPDTVSL